VNGYLVNGSGNWIPREWIRQLVNGYLVNGSRGEWDEKLVRQTFWPQDAEVIFAIPVHVDMEDVAAWHYDNRGLFTVRSAYAVQRAHEKRTSRRGIPSSSGSADSNKEGFWKKLWT
jgi:hypothetical protein